MRLSGLMPSSSPSLPASAARSSSSVVSGVPPVASSAFASPALPRPASRSGFASPFGFFAARLARMAMISSTIAFSLAYSASCAASFASVSAISVFSSAMRSSSKRPRSLSRCWRVELLAASFDRHLEVGDRRRRGALADRDAGAGGVEQAHRLVGQLPRRDVAGREMHGGDHRLVGNPHAMVLFHRLQDAAQHVAAFLDRRLLDVDRLEAAGQRRVLLEILAVLGPGRRADRPQRAARQRRLEQVRRVARALRAAGADQRVRFVDEQDDRRRRRLHLVDHRAQALLELTLHRRAGLHQADVEGAQADALELRRHVAVGEPLRKTFHHRGLADAGLAGQDRIVLAPPHQHVDDLADLLVAADHRVHFALLGLGGHVDREAIERGVAACAFADAARGRRPRARRAPSRPSAAGSPRRTGPTPCAHRLPPCRRRARRTAWKAG